MTIPILLDVILVVILVGYVAYGLKIGLTRGVFVIAGVAAGIVLAVFIAPAISQMIPYAPARIVVAIAGTIALVASGHALGAAVGFGIRAGLEASRLHRIDRAFGGLAVGVVAALVISTVSFSASQLGVPIVSKTIAASNVLQAIENATPPSVVANIARWRTVFVNNALPLLGLPQGDPNALVPSIDSNTPALAAAAQSVVKITGNAYACGQGQTGSGFVVSAERVVTNAHVVSGISRPVVEALNGQVLQSTIVYFDPIDDLAVLAVPDLNLDPLAMTTAAGAGASTAIQGYPFGGPFTTNAALVQQISTFNSPNIYGKGSSPREVYTLAGEVNPGNSGGPLLTLDGDVVGAVFGGSTDQENVGYALTLTELQPVVDSAASFDTAVSSGDCISD